MNVLVLTLLCAVFLSTAYMTYGRLLKRLFKLDDANITPAVEQKDGKDFDPASKGYLFGQHFSAIAAAGPITGPILAGVMFGWLPALLWILIGSVFVGGVHDLAALMASIRHKARSIAEVVRMHVTHRSYLLFLAFIWIALVYIIVAFTDIIASTMVGTQTLDNGTQVSGGAIATSSLLYLLIPIAMGLCMKFLKLPLGWATVIFLPLVGVAIWGGKYIPLDITGAITTLFGTEPEKAKAVAKMMWCLGLLAYCVWASVAPVWLLLQPRGYLGGWFLYVTLAAAAVGITFGGFTINYPAVVTPEPGMTQDAMFPFLFITIACGACSGFHSIIASGTTSKQLSKETDALPVAYGSMLLEAMVSVISLVCVMMLTKEALAAMGNKPKPDLIYAIGQAKFMGMFGIPETFAITFGLLAFTTFIYDTLDVCTRLGRYIVEELTGWTRGPLRHMATLLTVGVPLFFIFITLGEKTPAWRTYWTLFGASNQLLAALTLVGVCVWLWQTQRKMWVWLVVGIPTVLMYVTSFSALAVFVFNGFWGAKGLQMAANPVPYAALVLMVLAGWVLVEAIRTIVLNFESPDPTDGPGKDRARRGVRKTVKQAMRRNMIAWALCTGLGLLVTGPMAGCSTVTDPETRVVSATLAEETEAGARILVEVELVSTNKVALPLTNATYSGEIEDIGDYSGTDLPNRTIPIASRQTVILPLIYKTDEPVSGREISVSGDITYEPPGQIRKLLTESGVPLPSTGFSGTVKIDAPPATQPAATSAPAHAR